MVGEGSGSCDMVWQLLLLPLSDWHLDPFWAVSQLCAPPCQKHLLVSLWPQLPGPGLDKVRWASGGTTPGQGLESWLWEKIEDVVKECWERVRELPQAHRHGPRPEGLLPQTPASLESE